MPNPEQQPVLQYTDPNHEPVYKGGAQPSLVKKGEAQPLAAEDVFDDCGRVLFGE